MGVAPPAPNTTSKEEGDDEEKNDAGNRNISSPLSQSLSPSPSPERQVVESNPLGAMAMRDYDILMKEVADQRVMILRERERRREFGGVSLMCSQSTETRERREMLSVDEIGAHCRGVSV